MGEYTIKLTDDAVENLTEIRDYIANTLLAPETALNYIRSIRKEITRLSDFPSEIKPVEDEPWHSIGIRRILAKNFFVYFRVDENSKTVFILNVLYARRDQIPLLEKTKSNLT